MESGFDPLKVKVRGKSSMGSTWRRGSFAYNTIPTAEEILYPQCLTSFCIQLMFNVGM
jgi:hypothetical protein